ncbi:hypothetical protein ACH5RR_014761 [Cinchona calisaya]|uniref:Uncharacterized protein n=1 Tax=Cinchona calisaya TaxID=153742 RepID=A0ABD2ZUS8_9GENT
MFLGILTIIDCSTNNNNRIADFRPPRQKVGVEAEDNTIDLLLSQVEGKHIAQLIVAGREKFSSVPAAGGAAVTVATVAPA